VSGPRKRLLVVACDNQPEALRVATGLTLLNDSVKVDVLGVLQAGPEVAQQKEVLDFAEVPCEVLAGPGAIIERLAQDVLEADVVYLI
jgi:hypothetical protein